MRRPPGASSTRANKRRASCINGGVGRSPSANNSWRSATSSNRTQDASRAPMRLAISAAPALVKVRHRIASGRTPASSKRSTRAVSTWVLPVPAEADSAACADGIGSEALIALQDRQWFEAARHAVALASRFALPKRAKARIMSPGRERSGDEHERSIGS